MRLNGSLDALSVEMLQRAQNRVGTLRLGADLMAQRLTFETPLFSQPISYSHYSPNTSVLVPS